MEKITVERVKRALYHRIYRRALRYHSDGLVALDDFRFRRSQGASYRNLIRNEKKRDDLCGRGHRWHVKSKEVGLKFAARENVPILSSDLYPDVDSVLQKLTVSTAPQVVKPLAGWSSLGVFIVFSRDDVFDLGRYQKVNSLEIFQSRLREVDTPGWIVEPYCASVNDPRCPAHDLKFYSFYGEIGLVLEVRRHPDIRFCWWSADGKNIGKAKHNQVLFQGDGFAVEEMEWAKRLSAEIPAPFMRIDFLKSGQGAFFGEFTPRPGEFDRFYYEIDASLGKLYLEAEARLLKDLLEGKSFKGFREITESA